MSQHQPKQSEPGKPRFRRGEPVYHTLLKTSPLMIVVGPERKFCPVAKRDKIIGIRCYWFKDDMSRASDLFESAVLRHLTERECVLNGIDWNALYALGVAPAAPVFTQPGA